MSDGTKTCVACAEEIQVAAKLCRYCGTQQDDKRFAGAEPGPTQEFLEKTPAEEPISVDGGSIDAQTKTVP